jgi:hypothetical protein
MGMGVARAARVFRTFAPIAFVLLGACASSTGPATTFQASYTPRNAPASCSQAVDQEGHRRCIAGDGNGCANAVRRLTPTITFADSMSLALPAVHNAQMECIASYGSYGCSLGSGSSCAILGSALTLLGDKAGAHNAWVAACDRNESNGCWYASGIGAASPVQSPVQSRWNASYADVMFAERGCDLGSFHACRALADLALIGGNHTSNPYAMVEQIRDRHGDVARGLYYWERACMLGERARGAGWSDDGACADLRKLLMVPDAPRRNDDDLLPVLSQFARGEAPKQENWCLEFVNNEFTGNSIPCDQVKENSGAASSGRGICEIDPTACPSAAPSAVPASSTRPHPWPPQLLAIAKQKRGTAERARILEAHRSSCARGSPSDCSRSVELELMRVPYLVYSDERNQGEAPAFSPLQVTRDLCARNNADACTFLGSFTQDTWSAIRACDLGSARGCAIAGHLGRYGPDSQRASSMLARGCAGGIRWSCGLR